MYPITPSLGQACTLVHGNFFQLPSSLRRHIIAYGRARIGALAFDALLWNLKYLVGWSRHSLYVLTEQNFNFTIAGNSFPNGFVSTVTSSYAYFAASSVGVLLDPCSHHAVSFVRSDFAVAGILALPNQIDT